MKKLRLKSAALVLLIGVSVVACHKENIKTSTNAQCEANSTTDQPLEESSKLMMTFKTSTDFENLVSKSSADQKSELKAIEGMRFVSYKESMQMNKSANNQIDDEFLASILNKDMIVRIGDNLYRLNKPEEKVYVLPMQYITEYNDLVAQNMKNHHIKKFSTDDSVIEMVESGELGEKKAFCGEDGVGSRHQEVEQYNGSTGGSNTAITSLSHNKYGIYFTITIETSSREPLGSTFKYEFSDSQSERACKIKCSDWNYADQFMSSVYLTFYSKISLGNTSRNFSRYNEKVRVHLYKGSGFDQLISTSDWIQIRANM